MNFSTQSAFVQYTGDEIFFLKYQNHIDFWFRDGNHDALKPNDDLVAKTLTNGWLR